MKQYLSKRYKLLEFNFELFKNAKFIVAVFFCMGISIIIASITSCANIRENAIYPGIIVEGNTVYWGVGKTEAIKFQDIGYKENFYGDKYKAKLEEMEERAIVDTFMVKKIFEEKGVFEIILLKDSVKYEIVSIDQERTPNGKKIKEGRRYIFKILPYFSMEFMNPEIKVIREFVPLIYIDGYCVEGAYKIKGQLYTTPNLKGLYYIPDGADL